MYSCPPCTILETVCAFDLCYGGNHQEHVKTERLLDPIELPTELLRLILDEDRDSSRRMLETFHAIVIAVWRDRGILQEERKYADHSAAAQEDKDRTEMR